MWLKQFGHRILVITNVFLAVGLLLSYVSVYINPSVFWLPAFIGLLYPFFLLTNLIFLFYWVFRWKKEVLISLVVIVIGIGHLNSYVQFPFGKSKHITDSTEIKVLSYNVNLFRLYSWSDKKPSFDSIINYVKQNNFDIVCLQEFYVDNKNLSEAQFKKKIGLNTHVSYILKRSTSAYGIAIISRYPIVNSGDVMFQNTFNACTYADIKINNDTIRVYNLHLQSTRLKKRNFDFLLNQNFRAKSNKVREVSDLMGRLGNAFIKRAIQVDLVKTHIDLSPYPVLLCGDFNDSPVSYTYHVLTKKLKDSFTEAGIGILATFRGIWPAYRIDYILHSRQFSVFDYSSPQKSFSDHYPVKVTVKLNRLSRKRSTKQNRT